MQLKKLPYFLFAALLVVFVLASAGWYFSGVKVTKEIPRSDEKELKVNLEAGFGEISVSKGKSSLILDSDGELNKNNSVDDCINYMIRDRVGYLNLNTNCSLDKSSEKHKKSSSIHMDNLESNQWTLQFTDAIPIAFDVELGLGKGVFDFTDLAVKDLRLSTGASSVHLMFNKPNKNVIEDLTIEAGLSKFYGSGLANANFNHLKFEGGVGSYKLDFSGELDKEVDVDVEVGLGSLTIVIPEETGSKIYYEKSWIAHLSIDKDFVEEQNDTYFSPNYRTAAGKINMKIEAGLGSVKIIRK